VARALLLSLEPEQIEQLAGSFTHEQRAAFVEFWGIWGPIVDAKRDAEDYQAEIDDGDTDRG
jgi:hypothetical protein